MKSLGEYMKHSHLGLQFLLAVGLPTAGGIWLDSTLGTRVLFTLLGLFLGFAAGVYSLYFELFRAKKRRENGSTATDGRAKKDGKDGSARLDGGS